MNTDDLFDALERCAKTTSKKEKLAIVKTLSAVNGWLRWALDPTISFYVAKLPKPSHHGDGVMEDSDERLLMRLSARQYTGNEALQRIDDTLRELTPKSQEVLRRVLLKDLRCGVGASIVNDAFPGLIPVFPYMRCCLEKDSNMHKWNWDDGIIVQLKADGMFANVNVEIGGARIFSRQGSPFPEGSLGGLEKRLYDTLNNGTQTHGELLVFDGDGMLLERQVGNGILNSLLQGGQLPAGHEVCFFAWDQIPLTCAVDKGRYEIPYDQRLAGLCEQIAESRKLGLITVSVNLIDTEKVFHRGGAMEIYRRYLKDGLEGVICKHPKAIWRDGDNKDQVKLKQEADVDLKIVGYRPGTPGTRTEATFGAVLCRTADGLLEVGVHGFKREIEADIHARRDELLGKVMTVRANGVMNPTEDGALHSLFLPRFVELRQDKQDADTLQRVRDQFEAAIAV